jgi:predicted outer membrane repeat protein
VLSAGNLTLQAVVFDSCSAEQSGGAVHSTAEGYTTSTGCTFSRNKVSNRML